MSIIRTNDIIETSFGSGRFKMNKVVVTFNGTGTVTPQTALNISSLTDYGVGRYTANFTNNMFSSSYYAFTTTCHFNATYKDWLPGRYSATQPRYRSTNNCNITCYDNGSFNDTTSLGLICVGDLQ